MEALKIIWIGLATENNLLLINIQGMFLLFIETFVGMLLFSTILNIKSTRKQRLLYVFFVSLIGILTLFIIPSPYNAFINLIAIFIFVLIIFRVTILKALIALVLQTFISIIIGMILLNLFLILFHLSTTTIENTPIYRLLLSLLQYLLTYFLYIFFKKYNININLLADMNQSTNIALTLNFTIGIIAIAIQSYIVVVINDSVSFFVTFISLAVVIGYFSINLYSLSRSTKLVMAMRNLEEEKLINKTLSMMYDNISAFRHDFNNIVQSIGGYIANEDISGLKKYYDQLVNDCQRVNDTKILSPDIINNPAIYSLFVSKYHIADDKGITLTYYIHMDINSLKMKVYEFTRVLGILIDNAIEAASLCSDKIINITIDNDAKIARQLVIIENTYTNKDVDTHKIFEKGYTSKKDSKSKHGLGLWEVNKILNRSNNLSLYTAKDETFFRQQLEIYL